MKYKINKIIVVSIVSIFALTGLSVGFATLNDEINIEDRNLDWGWVQLINVEDNSCPPPYYPTSDPDYGCDPEYGFFEISDNLGWGPLPLDKNVGCGTLTQIDEDILELTVNNAYPGYWNGITAHVHYIEIIPITIQEAILSWNSDGTDIIAVINDENEGEIIHIDLDGDSTIDMELMDKNDFNHQLEYDDKQEYSWDFCFLQTLPQSSTFIFYITLRATRSDRSDPPPSPSYYSPTSDPNGPYYGFIGEKIEFDGTSSHDNDENGESIERYDWKFFEDDDWHEDFGPTPTFIYNESGDYTVTLRVYDDENSYDVKTTTAHIIQLNKPPSVPIINGTITGHKNTTYEFTALSFDENNDTIQYIFNWGDGKTTKTEFLPNGIPVIQTHKWANHGEYIISVKASDNKTDSGTSEHIILIDVLPIDDEIKGYLVDEDSDETYDLFDDNETGEQIDVEKDNITYLIDTDGDGKYDYTYNIEKGLLTYYEYLYQKYYPKIQGTSGFEVISLLSMIALVFVIIKRRRKQQSR